MAVVNILSRKSQSDFLDTPSSEYVLIYKAAGPVYYQNRLIMAKEKAKTLTVEQLEKRKRNGSVFLAILIATGVLSLLVVIYKLITGDGLNPPLLVAAIACFTVAIPIYLGKKKIDLELKSKGRN